MNIVNEHNLRFNEFGLPIIKDNEIEKIAYDFLRKCNAQALESPQKIFAGDLIDFMKKTYSIKIGSDSLGETDGKQVLAYVQFSRNTIVFHRDLVYDDAADLLYRMTVAHEIGHWILHGQHEITDDQSKQIVSECEELITDAWFSDDIPRIQQRIKEFTTNFLEYPRRKKLLTVRDWMEHHAKVFAGALLMPETPFKKAFIDILLQMDIKLFKGGRLQIYLDNQECNKQMARTVIDRLQNIFGTSRVSIKIRMEKLNLLIVDQRIKRTLGFRI